MGPTRAVGVAATLMTAACGVASESPVVRPGIEVLLEDSLHLVAGLRVGILTHQAGVDRDRVPDVERLLGAGLQVTAIFSPEHGYWGLLDREGIVNVTDSATGISIFSLYDDTRVPTPEELDLIDVLLIDLQDIGGRPYSYISTALLVMEAAAASPVHVIVLDRPNPIGGDYVQGPVLDTAYSSFNGMLTIPQRHGMTLGELAVFGNASLNLGARLTVVPASGWERAWWHEQTGLPWIRPSLSMPNIEAATQYPGLVLFEATNLSVGRGTPHAFQMVGAPWLDVDRVIALIGEEPGVRMSPTMVTPAAPPDRKYDAVEIPAILMRVTDRDAFDPIRSAVRILAAVWETHRDALEVGEARMAQLMGTSSVWDAVAEGRAGADIASRWEEPLSRFRAARRRFLLY